MPTVTELKAEKTILWHTSENGHALTIPGVILVCDADTQHATIRVHRGGHVTQETVKYREIEVRG